jgi:ABC-2 type transport system permease protein
MPDWLEAFVNVNPITFLVTAIRGLMFDEVMAREIGWVLLTSVLLTAVFSPLTMYLYRKKS